MTDNRGVSEVNEVFTIPVDNERDTADPVRATLNALARDLGGPVSTLAARQLVDLGEWEWDSE